MDRFTPFFISFSLALALTLLFGFRHRVWERPKYLAGYFLFFFALEWAAEAWLIPPHAFGIEIAYVCLVIAALVSIAVYITSRVEKTSDRDS